MKDTIAELMGFDRDVRRRGAARVIEFPEGVVVRHDGLPVLHHLNAVLLDAPLPAALADPAAITALADEHLEGLGHRTLVLDDYDAGERLAPSLLEAGWTRQRVAFMLKVRDPDHPPRPGVARWLGDQEAHVLQHAVTAEEAPADESGPSAVAAALVSQLVEGQEAMRVGTPSLVFGAGEPGQPLASMCTLFLGPGIAMIEEVGTLSPQRGRGLARAVVCAAIEAAVEQGCERIFVPADIDDWPQLLYVKLGFEPVCKQVSFTLRTVGDRA